MTDDVEQEQVLLTERGILGRWSRLCRKELREILRDRRTMITLLVMPLIVYPLLALVFQRFLFSSLLHEGGVEYVVGFESRESARFWLQCLEEGRQLLPPEAAVDVGFISGTAGTEATAPTIRPLEIARGQAESLVADGSLNLAVLSVRNPTRHDTTASIRPQQSFELVYRRGSPSGEAVLRYVQLCLQTLNDAALNQQLEQLDFQLTVPAVAAARSVEVPLTTSFSLAALLPLILVLMTVTGAVYPAIDLTAGERERGTLETLVAAPIPRLGLLTAKYVAVLTVAVLTAVVNLLGMTFTARSTGLDAVLLGEMGLSATVVLKVLGLLVLFAAFFSAILLALTSYARSFKEAQAYIIPLMLVCLVPGILCLLPGVELGGMLAVTPLANIVLLARDLLEGGVNPTMAAAVIISTALYVGGAIALAARIFGTDAILYGSSASWSSLFAPPPERRHAVDATLTLLSLAVLFPAHFVLSNVLAGYAHDLLARRLIMGAAVTVLLFAGLPLVVVSLLRVPLAKGLQLAVVPVATLIAAAILGTALWPFAYEIVLWQKEWGLVPLEAEKLTRVAQLAEQISSVSPWLLVVTLGIVPGVCEELFFRGYLLGALRNTLTPAKAIIASAVLFGLFHVISSLGFAERFLPSTFMGLVLGWVCVRAGSVIPGMLLHAVHNSLLLLVVHYRERLEGWGIGTEAQTHLPMTWIAGATLIVAVGAILLIMTTRRSRER